MTERKMTSEQQNQLEALVDACSLDLVLGGLANICAATTDHYEQLARAAGWTRDGDFDGIIYNTNDYGSWKEALSWSPERGAIYDTWQECCEMEALA